MIPSIGDVSLSNASRAEDRTFKRRRSPAPPCCFRDTEMNLWRSGAARTAAQLGSGVQEAAPPGGEEQSGSRLAQELSREK